NHAVGIAQEERDAVALVAVDDVVADVDARARAAAVDDDAAALGGRRAVALVRAAPGEPAPDGLTREPRRALVVRLARAVVSLARGAGVVKGIAVADRTTVTDGAVGFTAARVAGVVA